MKLPDLDKISKYFYYDETSPSSIRWKIQLINGKAGVGNVAGYKRPNNYWFTGVDKRQYQNGLLVLLLHGFIPEENQVVDHIDGDPSNNNIRNLRFVDYKINARNRKLPVSNKTGYIGVNSNSKIVKVEWYDLEGNKQTKAYSINKYGYAQALELAINFRKSKILELNNLGAGYTDRHGTNTK